MPALDDIAPKASTLSQKTPIKLLLVAGEASGDKHGAALARSLVQQFPQVDFQLFGSGGAEMREAGVDTIVDVRDVAIIGVPEVLAGLRKLFGAYRTISRAALTRGADAAVLIDWPDFNLKLARRLSRHQMKVIYYISPQVWAWKKYRIRAIRKYVDRMLVIFPFEEDFYRRHGVEAEYVGHPLTRLISVTANRDEFSRSHGLDPLRPIISLLPGSRKKEVQYHLPEMLDAAIRLSEHRFFATRRAAAAADASVLANGESKTISIKPYQAQFVLPLASTVTRASVEGAVRGANARHGTSVSIIENDLYNALAHSEIAVVASGTATVEAALVGTPMVIVYRSSELNWRLLRPLIHLDTFGMVNLIAGRRIVPELIQREVTGEKIAREVVAILNDPPTRSSIQRDLAIVRERLTVEDDGGSNRAARAIMEEIGVGS